jgi:hypothetical protein
LDDERAINRLLKGKPCGRGEKGRPSFRWTDDVEMDLRNVGGEEEEEEGEEEEEEEEEEEGGGGGGGGGEEGGEEGEEG